MTKLRREEPGRANELTEEIFDYLGNVPKEVGNIIRKGLVGRSFPEKMELLQAISLEGLWSEIAKIREMIRKIPSEISDEVIQAEIDEFYSKVGQNLSHLTSEDLKQALKLYKLCRNLRHRNNLIPILTHALKNLEEKGGFRSCSLSSYNVGFESIRFYAPNDIVGNNVCDLIRDFLLSTHRESGKTKVVQKFYQFNLIIITFPLEFLPKVYKFLMERR